MTGIIFEGADASGKSTLARKIAERSGRPLYLAGGKPANDTEMWRMINDQADACNRGMLVDRVSSVSQQIYREGLFFRTDLMDEVWNLVHCGHVLVYCRPPDSVLMDPKSHEWKPYDTEEWKTNVLSNQSTFVQRYDRLMSVVPCIIYDWTSEESTHIEEVLCNLHSEGVSNAVRDLTRRPA